jgi:hypothetical protein
MLHPTAVRGGALPPGGYNIFCLIETCNAYNYMFCSKHFKCSYLDVYDLELVIELSRRV